MKNQMHTGTRTSLGSSLKSLISIPVREENTLRNSNGAASESARELSADIAVLDKADESLLDKLSASSTG